VRSQPAITDPEINPKPAINEVVTMSKIDLNSETSVLSKKPPLAVSKDERLDLQQPSRARAVPPPDVAPVF